MHRVLTIIAVLAISTPGMACLGPMSEEQLLYNTLPASLQQAPLIAEIVITDTDDRYPVSGRVVQTIRGVTKKGETIYFEPLQSSCGPFVETGARGIVAAQRLRMENGHLFITPYTHRAMDSPAATQQ